ncbi:hypothetical protein H2199_008870 [Coniosporium tulheliwenetii]|uniref:Uncharacterized protein n=1 Tax=Coniosporium tulheliwenetii TaxID=3383036 RepID=A0ACC2YHA1_9PEZI|nr:hypothetical protein H2199_008870 [Cladosporium sp. JES 115]
MSFTSINLPLPILLHSLTLTGLGLTLLIRPHRSPLSFLTRREIFAPNTSTSSSPSPAGSSAKITDPASTHPAGTSTSSAGAASLDVRSARVVDTSSLLGIATLALGLTYLGTSHVPVAENQFLHASVPVRLLISVLLGTSVLVRGRGMSQEVVGASWVGGFGWGWGCGAGAVVGQLGWEDTCEGGV